MHEFSLARNILEIAEETLQKFKAVHISEIILEIGTLSGVENDALDLALESLKQGSVLEKALITKVSVQAKARCRECRHEFLPDDFFAACPRCGSYNPEILTGKELRVKSITAE